VTSDAIVCESCRATFDAVWGTPFLGHYEAEDVPGLVEIASNARADNLYAGRRDIERIEGLLQQYEAAADRSEFLTTCPDEFAAAPWFSYRYAEYSAFSSLTKTLDFAGRDILDVGAGTGYDTWRLVERGGNVTAFEYNPVLIRRGRSVVPEARWIGGLAHALPFESETFDVVCCNAALHHMRDVPAAMHEMLRVVRPGGWLLTTGDPFRASHSGDAVELELFDRHADVLLGVNESVPPFGELVAALLANADRITVRFHTASLTDDRGGRLPTLLRRNHPAGREWAFRQRKRLSRASGTLAIRAKVREPLRLPAKLQGPTAMRAGDYASVLDDHQDALGALAPIIPAAFVDSDFPGERQTKFELLNGWQKPEPGAGYRYAYKRARWFLTRPEHSRTLSFSAKASDISRVASTLQIHVAGHMVGTVPLRGEWSEATVPVTHVPHSSRFVCELRAVPSQTDDLGFDDYRFVVKERRFVR
jgi:ubiquinone/menaquinone biosynthesis C-methylase UbiE